MAVPKPQFSIPTLQVMSEVKEMRSNSIGGTSLSTSLLIRISLLLHVSHHMKFPTYSPCVYQRLLSIDIVELHSCVRDSFIK